MRSFHDTGRLTRIISQGGDSSVDGGSSELDLSKDVFSPTREVHVASQHGLAPVDQGDQTIGT